MAKPKKEKSELAVVQGKITGMKKMVDETKVTSAEELGQVSDKVKQVKMMQKYIEQEKEKFTAPAKQIIAEARTKYDPYIKECKDAEFILKSKAMKYMEAEEEKKRIKEAEIAKKVESGTITTEKAIEKMDNLKEAPRSITSDNGSGLQMRKIRVAKIQIPDDVPKEYWIIDEFRVKREALERDKAGLPQIPGVIVVEESSMASR